MPHSCYSLQSLSAMLFPSLPNTQSFNTLFESDTMMFPSHFPPDQKPFGMLKLKCQTPINLNTVFCIRNGYVFCLFGCFFKEGFWHQMLMQNISIQQLHHSVLKGWTQRTSLQNLCTRSLSFLIIQHVTVLYRCLQLLSNLNGNVIHI